MDISVLARGEAYDEDCLGLDAAKQWAEQKLKQLGHPHELVWECLKDVYTTTVSADLSARVERRG